LAVDFFAQLTELGLLWTKGNSGIDFGAGIGAVALGGIGLGQKKMCLGAASVEIESAPEPMFGQFELLVVQGDYAKIIERAAVTIIEL
jgi:hypothetical protein